MTWFIPVFSSRAAERTGLISEVDRAVRSRVVQDWDALARMSDIKRISVNVAEKELVPGLADELLASGKVSNLVVEVTESSILSNPQEAGETLRRIRAAGGLVAIDDFGSGYSSMAQIASLPCDILKIDRGFVASMLEQPKSMSLIRAMIQLATISACRSSPKEWSPWNRRHPCARWDATSARVLLHAPGAAARTSGLGRGAGGFHPPTGRV